MASERTFVIAGGGLAGAKAAETLRDEGSDGRILLVSAEDALPYERPPLSKDYLRGETERAAFATSPAANTPGTPVCSCSSTRIPFSTARPAAAASWVRGWTPMPTTTKSHAIRVPSVVRTRSTAAPPSNASTPEPSTIRTPWSAWMSR